MSNALYLSETPSSNFPFVELKENQHHGLHSTQTPVHEQAAASSTSSPHHHYFTTPTHQDQSGKHSSGESHHSQQKVNTHDLGAVISSAVGDVAAAPSSLTDSPLGIDSSRGGDNGSVRWMVTKVRLRIGKMVNCPATSTDRAAGTRSVVVQENSHDKELNISSSNGSSTPLNVRVCSDCNTTKTPLWRSGPRGPKSLCNACGIRQRKARRAMVAAAEAASNGTVVDVGATSSYQAQNKDKKSRTSYHASQNTKQDTNIMTTSPAEEKKINKFEDLAMMSKNSAPSQRVFPRDEEEAAILLMALSCGLIHG